MQPGAPGTARRARDVVTRVMSARNDLAAGRATLPDYERSGLDQEPRTTATPWPRASRSCTATCPRSTSPSPNATK
ncbi:hypothetical protein [Nocardia farcinica]